MPKAFLKSSTIDHMAKEAAYHEFPGASETGFGADDIAWLNAYKAARRELEEQHRDGIGLQPGAFPGPGVVGLKSGLAFFCDGRDWYVDQNAASIEKVNAGALDILGGRRQ